jgi:hypothetical protein
VANQVPLTTAQRVLSSGAIAKGAADAPSNRKDFPHARRWTATDRYESVLTSGAEEQRFFTSVYAIRSGAVI